jgi:hypothetical protein
MYLALGILGAWLRMLAPPGGFVEYLVDFVLRQANFGRSRNFA